ncbi:MAG: endonuclease/exonuclease/phosphatase family protein [Chitinophagales bacterium]
MAKKGSFFDNFVFNLNLLAALILLLTYTSSFVNPQVFWPVALLGLGYPYALLLNILFILYWLFKKKSYALLSIITIASGWTVLQYSIGLHMVSPENTSDKNQKVKVMSYNVRNFDLYNWSENKNARNNMMQLIKNENADIICFQEFYTEDSGDFHNIKLLVNELGYSHHYFEKTFTLHQKDHWGLAIFSRFPIAKQDKIKFENAKNNLLLYADIEVSKNKTLRVFNAHLQSIFLGKKDLAYVKSLTKTKNNPDKPATDHLEASKSIIIKLRDAYIKRSIQAETLAKLISDSPYDVVVCGDFNDTPASYTYRIVKKQVCDAFLENSFGLGGTYGGLKPLLPFRIDYILHSPSLESHQFKVIQKNYSDHYPVSCEIYW